MRLSKKEMSTLIFNALKAKRKVGRLGFELEDLRPWLATIDEINSLDRATEVYGPTCEPLGLFNIPTPLGFLVYPKEVSNRTSLKDLDLLVRPGREKNVQPMNKREFNLFTDIILSGQKRSGETTSIVNLRTELSTADAMERLCVNGNVEVNDVGFLGFELLGQHRDVRYLNFSVCDALELALDIALKA